ncbi:hypothetical protein TNIN_369841 [Trichonephila inaurata madagascariensis]|uniref:Uncharacterized protein n=1 Tax=Trichonephila inaurata madagascariensis TaxID=2747483 RepID=A0A8X6IWG0_9ARAC|nr:hypothetical protein TNIN_369841 [Trichonephila inaurata madagascariensis]
MRQEKVSAHYDIEESSTSSFDTRKIAISFICVKQHNSYTLPICIGIYFNLYLQHCRELKSVESDMYGHCL